MYKQKCIDRVVYSPMDESLNIEREREREREREESDKSTKRCKWNNTTKKGYIPWHKMHKKLNGTTKEKTVSRFILGGGIFFKVGSKFPHFLVDRD